jgi:hypothetical protein
MLGDIPLSPVLPSTPMVDTLFGQCSTTMIIQCSVYGTNSQNMRYFAKYENYLGINFVLNNLGEFTPSYILHTRAFRTYLLEGYLPCKKYYKMMVFYM